MNDYRMSDKEQPLPGNSHFEVGEIKHQGLPADLLRITMQEISDFTVGIVIGDDLLGSGTLIDIGQRRGILTAHHVAELIVEADDDALALIVANHPHRLRVRPSHLAHTVIGAPVSKGDWRPDLSFLEIGDRKLLGTLASKKSFSYLNRRSLEAFFSYPRREELWWFVAGFPAEFSGRIKEGDTGELLTKSSNFVGQATLLRHFDQGDFDYLRLKLYDQAHGFPFNYGGISGGGIWMVPLTMNPDEGPHTAKAEELFLAGVCCYQHEVMNYGRDVEGHGPKSLYRRLQEIVTQGEQ
jgi:hypothetical protein